MRIISENTFAGEGSSSSSLTDSPGRACNCPRARPRARSRKQLSFIPAMVLLLLPKCPLCFAAWLGTLGSFGASSWLRFIWGTPLAIILLGVTVGSFALRAWRSRDVRPLLLGMLGALGLFGGKEILELLSLQLLGLVLLIGASVWSTWLTSTRTRRPFDAVSKSAMPAVHTSPIGR